MHKAISLYKTKNTVAGHYDRIVIYPPFNKFYVATNLVIHQIISPPI